MRAAPGRSVVRSPFDRVEIVANRHTHPHRPKVAEKGKDRLNPEAAVFLTDVPFAAQGFCGARGGFALECRKRQGG